ncbi:hypothetical protein C8C85_0929 [Flavobacterium sp. 103]|nr:hypothetical protein [Flavobacterium sp. 103]PVX45152.1 hypothetical protein C8C85_0929 [Flavobacterium sp. 103]
MRRKDCSMSSLFFVGWDEVFESDKFRHGGYEPDDLQIIILFILTQI